MALVHNPVYVYEVQNKAIPYFLFLITCLSQFMVAKGIMHHGKVVLRRPSQSSAPSLSLTWANGLLTPLLAPPVYIYIYIYSNSKKLQFFVFLFYDLKQFSILFIDDDFIKSKKMFGLRIDLFSNTQRKEKTNVFKIKPNL